MICEDDMLLPDESDLIRKNIQLSERLNHACDEIISLQKENKRLKEILEQLDYNHVERRVIDIKVEYNFMDPKFKHIKLKDSKTMEQNLYIDLFNRFNKDEGFRKLTVKCTDITDKLEKLNEKDKD